MMMMMMMMMMRCDICVHMMTIVRMISFKKQRIYESLFAPDS